MTLIDTSSWVEALRPAGKPATRTRVFKLLDQGEAIWCDMVRLELWNGALSDRDKKILRQFESELVCLPTDQATWAMACEFAMQARLAGVTIPATDLIVYACAKHHKVGLEHQDAHFDKLALL